MLEKTSRLLQHTQGMLLALLALASVQPTEASRVDIHGPTGSDRFGQEVALLPNGNFVVVQRGPEAETGAVHLYSADGNLLSTLTGGTPGDLVGSGSNDPGIVVLANGDFVVRSLYWDNPETGATDAGAVTLVDGDVGLSGVVSAANSLVGTTTEDRVGTSVLALKNGGYAVVSTYWDNGDVVDAGSITVVPPGATAVGAITASNSLVGSSQWDRLGETGVTVLANGNLVVCSPTWGGAAGAATWVDSAVGLVGPVSASNSLVGRTSGDNVGTWCATPLANGNYVVGIPTWHDGGMRSVGAATWGDGATGVVGEVSATNSLVGARAFDWIGIRVYALANGHYVVTSPHWNNGSTERVGAATWGDGYTGTIGQVTSTNSITANSTGSNVGDGGIIALTNGNYVVLSRYWNNGGAIQAGAATWADGSGTTAATVSAANSLVGTGLGQHVGQAGRPLANGNYVVQSPNWGSEASDAAPNRGAVTWGDGASGTVGVVSAANSLVGRQVEDRVGGTVAPLDDGNYVVVSAEWSNGAVAGVGAVTWVDGGAPVTGAVGPENSLIGTSAHDLIGAYDVLALPEGGYMFSSSSWDGPGTDRGAITVVRDEVDRIGVVNAENSLVGSADGDEVGFPVPQVFADGTVVIATDRWNSGGQANVGAVTFLPHSEDLAGPISPLNSVIGGEAGGGWSVSRTYAYDPERRRLMVGRAAENLVTLVTVPAPTLFADGFE